MATRYFTICPNSRFVTDIKKYYAAVEKQRLFVKAFTEKHGINARGYCVSGDGGVNTPLTNPKSISFAIEPDNETPEIMAMLRVEVPGHDGLRFFKKNSPILKAFAVTSVEEQIPINLHAPRLPDYISSNLGMEGFQRRYRDQYFDYEGAYYGMVECANALDVALPEGFAEIKGSEYHAALESAIEKQNAT